MSRETTTTAAAQETAAPLLIHQAMNSIIDDDDENEKASYLGGAPPAYLIETPCDFQFFESPEAAAAAAMQQRRLAQQYWTVRRQLFGSEAYKKPIQQAMSLQDWQAFIQQTALVILPSSSLSSSSSSSSSQVVLFVDAEALQQEKASASQQARFRLVWLWLQFACMTAGYNNNNRKQQQSGDDVVELILVLRLNRLGDDGDDGSSSSSSSELDQTREICQRLLRTVFCCARIVELHLVAESSSDIGRRRIAKEIANWSSTHLEDSKATTTTTTVHMGSTPQQICNSMVRSGLFSSSALMIPTTLGGQWFAPTRWPAWLLNTWLEAYPELQDQVRDKLMETPLVVIAAAPPPSSLAQQQQQQSAITRQSSSSSSAAAASRMMMMMVSPSTTTASTTTKSSSHPQQQSDGHRQGGTQQQQQQLLASSSSPADDCLMEPLPLREPRQQRSDQQELAAATAATWLLLQSDDNCNGGTSMGVIISPADEDDDKLMRDQQQQQQTPHDDDDFFMMLEPLPLAAAAVLPGADERRSSRAATTPDLEPLAEEDAEPLPLMETPLLVIAPMQQSAITRQSSSSAAPAAAAASRKMMMMMMSPSTTTASTTTNNSSQHPQQPQQQSDGQRPGGIIMGTQQQLLAPSSSPPDDCRQMEPLPLREPRQQRSDQQELAAATAATWLLLQSDNCNGGTSMGVISDEDDDKLMRDQQQQQQTHDDFFMMLEPLPLAAAALPGADERRSRRAATTPDLEPLAWWTEEEEEDAEPLPLLTTLQEEDAEPLPLLQGDNGMINPEQLFEALNTVPSEEEDAGRKDTNCADDDNVAAAQSLVSYEVSCLQQQQQPEEEKMVGRKEAFDLESPQLEAFTATPASGATTPRGAVSFTATPPQSVDNAVVTSVFPLQSAAQKGPAGVDNTVAAVCLRVLDASMEFSTNGEEETDLALPDAASRTPTTEEESPANTVAPRAADSLNPSTSTITSHPVHEAISFVKDAAAYQEAVLSCPEVVAAESSLDMFNEYCEGNVWQAAERLASYWTLRVRVFGRTDAFRRLKDALTVDDWACLKYEFRVILPPDELGRPVLLSDRAKVNSRQCKNFPLSARLRSAFAFTSCLATACSSSSSRRPGEFSVLSVIDTDRIAVARGDREATKLVGELLSTAICGRSASLNLVYISGRKRSVPSMGFFNMCRERILRFSIYFFSLPTRFHAGNETQVLESLKSCGYLEDHLPTAIGGRWPVEDKWKHEVIAYLDHARHHRQSLPVVQQQQQQQQQQQHRYYALPAQLTLAETGESGDAVVNSPYTSRVASVMARSKLFADEAALPEGRMADAPPPFESKQKHKAASKKPPASKRKSVKVCRLAAAASQNRTQRSDEEIWQNVEHTMRVRQERRRKQALMYLRRKQMQRDASR